MEDGEKKPGRKRYGHKRTRKPRDPNNYPEFPHVRHMKEDGFRELSEKQQAFLEHLLNPDPNRISQRKWGEENGVHPVSLTEWKKDRSFLHEWDKRATELNASTDRIQAVVNAMWIKAKNGDTKAAELYLKMVDRISPPTQKVVIESKGVGELTDEELSQAALSLVQNAEEDEPEEGEVGADSSESESA